MHAHARTPKYAHTLLHARAHTWHRYPMIEKNFGIWAVLWVQVVLALLGCLVSLVFINRNDEHAGEIQNETVATNIDPTEQSALLINADV